MKMDDRHYRIYDEGTDKVWARRFLTAGDARRDITRACTPDGFGSIMWNVLGPLHIIHLGNPFHVEEEGNR